MQSKSKPSEGKVSNIDQVLEKLSLTYDNFATWPIKIVANSLIAFYKKQSVDQTISKNQTITIAYLLSNPDKLWDEINKLICCNYKITTEEAISSVINILISINYDWIHSQFLDFHDDNNKLFEVIINKWIKASEGNKKQVTATKWLIESILSYEIKYLTPELIKGILLAIWFQIETREEIWKIIINIEEWISLIMAELKKAFSSFNRSELHAEISSEKIEKEYNTWSSEIETIIINSIRQYITEYLESYNNDDFDKIAEGILSAIKIGLETRNIKK